MAKRPAYAIQESDAFNAFEVAEPRGNNPMMNPKDPATGRDSACERIRQQTVRTTIHEDKKSKALKHSLRATPKNVQSNL